MAVRKKRPSAHICRGRLVGNIEIGGTGVMLLCEQAKCRGRYFRTGRVSSYRNVYEIRGFLALFSGIHTDSSYDDLVVG